MVPRTIAFARASGASRTPSRLCSSALSASTSSRWISELVVSFSNGMTAMVFTCAGSPPPAKPYMQPAVRRSATLQSPDLRIECHDGLIPRDFQGQLAAGREGFIDHLSFLPIDEVPDPS